MLRVMTVRRIAKVGLILAAIFGIAVVLFRGCESVVEHAFLSGMCGNTIRAESTSPGGRWKAVVFGRSCGATTSVSTEVSILRVGDDLPNASGNICAVGVFPDVALLWLNDRELIIRYPGGAKIFPVVQTFQGIDIKYEVQTDAASNKRLPTGSP